MTLRKSGVLRSCYTLSDGDSVVATAEEYGMWRRRLALRTGTGIQAIVHRKWYSSDLLVRAGDVDLGVVRKRGLFASGARIDLSESLPLHLRVFIGWIAMVRWRQAAAAASG